MVERRKVANPNKDAELQADKKAKKAERDALRKRAEEVKRASWKYGLGAAGVIITIGCLYSLVTISRAAIITVPLDDQAQLKEASFAPPPPRHTHAAPAHACVRALLAREGRVMRPCEDARRAVCSFTGQSSRDAHSVRTGFLRWRALDAAMCQRKYHHR
jgi:hypothetical protein